ncbi:hypothetical protein D3C71_1293650 [compost metagenome]
MLCIHNHKMCILNVKRIIRTFYARRTVLRVIELRQVIPIAIGSHHFMVPNNRNKRGIHQLLLGCIKPPVPLLLFKAFIHHISSVDQHFSIRHIGKSSVYRIAPKTKSSFRICLRISDKQEFCRSALPSACNEGSLLTYI